MKNIFIFFILNFAALTSNASLNTQKENPDWAKNRSVVLMISIDGFRYDYLDKIKPPNLLKIAEAGVRAEGLVPSFPTLTFPNHISLVTGLTPGHHGIVSNFFYDEKLQKTYGMSDKTAVNDPSWYRGEPLWAAVEKSGMLAATYFWVGSESKIAGVDPTYLVPYDGSIPNMKRGEQVIEWLSLPEKSRPHFVALYFSDVDSAGHKHGPDSVEVKNAVLEIDAVIGKVYDELGKLNIPLQIIIVSDHGMEEVSTDRLIYLNQLSDMKPFTSVEQGALINLYSDDEAQIEKTYHELRKVQKNFTVYRRKQLPYRWFYTDAHRVGDLVVVADPGYYLKVQQSFSNKPEKLNAATHGWDNNYKNMRGLFIAQGSLIRSKQRIKPFANVHVYPFVLNLLGLKPQQAIDGELSVLRPVLLR